MQVVLGILVFMAFATWIFTVVNAIEMVSRRRPDVPLSKLIGSGMAFFDDANFTPEAAPYKRRFVRGFMGFFALTIPTALLGVLSSM